MEASHILKARFPKTKKMYFHFLYFWSREVDRCMRVLRDWADVGAWYYLLSSVGEVIAASDRVGAGAFCCIGVHHHPQREGKGR